MENWLLGPRRGSETEAPPFKANPVDFTNQTSG